MPFELPSDKPLTVASYIGGDLPTAYVEPVGVGDPLPGIPLFLTKYDYVPCPLEVSYMQAWSVFPAMLKELIESPAKWSAHHKAHRREQANRDILPIIGEAHADAQHQSNRALWPLRRSPGVIGTLLRLLEQQEQEREAKLKALRHAAKFGFDEIDKRKGIVLKGRKAISRFISEIEAEAGTKTAKNGG
jgi:hypothetical protein